MCSIEVEWTDAMWMATGSMSCSCLLRQRTLQHDWFKMCEWLSAVSFILALQCHIDDRHFSLKYNFPIGTTRYLSSTSMWLNQKKVFPLKKKASTLQARVRTRLTCHRS